jgi:hypothetical protein
LEIEKPDMVLALGIETSSSVENFVKNLEGIEWTAGINVRTYGVRVGARTNSERALEALKRRLPGGWKPSASAEVDRLYSLVTPRSNGRTRRGQPIFLYNGAGRVVCSEDIETVLREFEIDLHSFVACTARQRTFIHAGVVGWGDRAIVMPGKNFSGKTSLVTAFLRAGAQYYSDEFAVLDNRGRVHPYPWPLHIREKGLPQPRSCPVEALGGKPGKKPLPVGAVIFSEYREGARWRPRTLTKGKAALAMLDNVLSTRQRPESLLPMLGRAVSDATILKGARGEADEVVGAIVNRMGS